MRGNVHAPPIPFVCFFATLGWDVLNVCICLFMRVYIRVNFRVRAFGRVYTHRLQHTLRADHVGMTHFYNACVQAHVMHVYISI